MSSWLAWTLQFVDDPFQQETGLRGPRFDKDIVEAQRAIAVDWVDVYRYIVASHAAPVP